MTVAIREERPSSNQSFGAWGEEFRDRVIATAILDRVLPGRDAVGGSRRSGLAHHSRFRRRESMRRDG